MKIAHISDIHYCPKRKDWVDLAMHSAITEIIDQSCDAVVISGDSMDHGMGVHETAFQMLFDRVLELAAEVPVLILQGTYSHDRPGSLDIFKGLPTKHEIFVADKPGVIYLECGTWTKHSDGTDAMFVCLPSLNKAAVGDAQQYVADFAASVRPQVDQANKASIPTVLVTHGTINGSITESKHAMCHPDHEFTQEILFGFRCDAVMIGHIHAHQHWVNDPQIIAYPGSLARLVHGDHSSKGFLIWNWNINGIRFCLDFDFIESPTRQLLEIEFDGVPDMEELDDLASRASEDDAVRIRWSIDAEFADMVDKEAIRALFVHCDTVKLEATVLPIESIRTPGISKAATLEEKIGMWMESTGDTGSTPRLTDKLSVLRSQMPDEIITTTIEKL